MDNLIRKLQVIANIAIVIVSILISSVIVKYVLLSDPTKSSANTDSRDRVSIGTKLSISGLDWAQNGHTLLLALSPNCHYCSESAPFYQQLSKEVGVRRGITLTALFPNSASNGLEYLKKMNVLIHDIRQTPFASAGIKGTPTIILVDSNGFVKKVWLGKLIKKQEAEVINQIQSFPSA